MSISVNRGMRWLKRLPSLKPSYFKGLHEPLLGLVQPSELVVRVHFRQNVPERQLESKPLGMVGQTTQGQDKKVGLHLFKGK